MLDPHTAPARVTAAELVRGFGRWQDHAAAGPVFVTRHGRERLVMLSVDRWRALGGECNRELPAPRDDRLTALADRIAQGFMAFDADLRFVAVNPVAAAYLRTSATALVGESAEDGDRFPDLARSLLHGHLLRAIRTAEETVFEAPSLAYPGAWLQFRTFGYGGGAACLFRNITDEIEARRRAGVRSALSAALGAHGGVGQGRLSARGAFIEVDETLADMTGFTPEGLRHVRLTDILGLGARVEAGAAIEAVLAGSGPRAFDTMLLVNRGGELPARVGLAALDGGYVNEGAVITITRR